MKFRTALAAAVAITAAAASVSIVAMPRDAAAQAATVDMIPQSEEVTLQAKIKKIDTTTRAITLEGASDQRLTVIAGPLVRLDLLKAGQTVNAKYYRSVAFAVQGPSGGNGTPVSGDQMAAMLIRPAQAPGSVMIKVVKITGTIVAVDLSSNSISVVNPSGGQVYTLDVTDPARQAMLPKLNVGDTITAVVSQVLAISVEPAKKSWF